MRLWGARGLRLGCVVVAAAIAATCVTSETEQCGKGVCPANLHCLALPDPAPTACVNDHQLDACKGVADQTKCSVDGIDGTCVGEACFPATCGDFVTDLMEACDDGNRLSGDGCSMNCLSLERCGDGLVDSSRGEQCDDGAAGRAGDGCSSSCLDEYDLWRNLTPRVPLSRLGGAFALDPVRGVLLFGGTAGSGATPMAGFAPLGDTWRWDGTHWSELATPTGSPSGRTEIASAYDPTRRRTMIFGGRGGLGGTTLYLDDLWEWDGLTWTERVVTGAKPSRRSGAAFACGPTRCVLFGGTNGAMLLSDTWIWNGTSWSSLPTAGPNARTGAMLVYDSARSLFVLIGGSDRQDTWELTTQWTQVADAPVSLTSHGATFDEVSNTIVMVNANVTYRYNGTWTNTGAAYLQAGYIRLAFDPGARRVTAINSNDITTVHQFTTTTSSFWNPLSNAPPAKNPRGLISTFDPVRGRTIVVDPGIGSTLRSTWEWDGATWRQTATAGSAPPASLGAALAFDTSCGEAIRFGGELAQPTNETWIYTAGTWMQYTGPAPTARRAHTMTYDAKRGAVVLFGGHSGATALADLWEWRGSCGAKAWTQVTATGPSARHKATLAFDERRGVSVLFGGEGSNTVSADTWEWDGSTWTQAAPTVSPRGRSEHAMTYDPRRKAVVMVGGRDGALRYDDSWRWDGDTWTEIVPVIPLTPARSGMTMSPDVTGGLLVIGGESMLVPVPDIWRLRSETSFEPTETCVLAAADLDGDGLAGCADPDCGGRCAPSCGFTLPCSGPGCGDGTCSVVEDYLICPADCPAPL